MSTRIEIRRAVPADALPACTLLRRSIEEGCRAEHQDQPGLLDAWLGNKTPATVGAWFASPTNCVLVAERDGELVGLTLLTQAGKLALCYVLPDALRCGVGRQLLAAVEAQARLWNISKLFLHSPAGASVFFERHGFLNAGKEKSCYGLECDLLWKRLDGVCDPAARARFCQCSE